MLSKYKNFKVNIFLINSYATVLINIQKIQRDILLIRFFNRFLSILSDAPIIAFFDYWRQSSYFQ